MIFDEAHQLVASATELFGGRDSQRRALRALDDAERALRHAGALDALLTRSPNVAVDVARSAVATLFAELARGVSAAEPRRTLERDVWAGPAQKAAGSSSMGRSKASSSRRAMAREQAAPYGAEAGRRPSSTRVAFAGDALDATERRMSQLREQLSAIVDGGAGRVTWLELGPRGNTLSSSPVDLSWLLRQRVFESVPAVVLTSATLATRAVRPTGNNANAASPTATGLGARAHAGRRRAALRRSAERENADEESSGYVRSRLGLERRTRSRRRRASSSSRLFDFAHASFALHAA